MARKTPEEIAKIAEGKSHRAQRRLINKLYRAQDDSDKWPTNGRFNTTNRAIRKAQWFENQVGTMSALEYSLFLDSEISRIVNDPKNW